MRSLRAKAVSEGIDIPEESLALARQAAELFSPDEELVLIYLTGTELQTPWPDYFWAPFDQRLVHTGIDRSRNDHLYSLLYALLEKRTRRK